MRQTVVAYVTKETGVLPALESHATRRILDLRVDPDTIRHEWLDTDADGYDGPIRPGCYELRTTAEALPR